MSDHNPIYHLKDSYFFEVPKALWRRDWQSLDDVPAFLRAPYDSDHMPSLSEFNEAMSGKVLIPQPFGQLDSLYAMKSGIGISKYMLLEVAVGGVILLLFTWLAKRIASGTPAKGRMANLLEVMLLFVRDQIAPRRSTTNMPTPTTTAMSTTTATNLFPSSGPCFSSFSAAISSAWFPGPARRRRRSR